MNILIPMAGRGTRISGQVPKPLFKIFGKPMIYHVIKSLNLDGNYIFITRKYENEEFNIELKKILNDLCENPKIIDIDYITNGPVSSALLAKDYINNDERLIISNCDQIMNWNSNKFKNKLTENLDGVVVTYNKITNKNSYIKIDENGYGIELKEKEIISEYSLNGIHYWKCGKDFVYSAEELIKNNIRINNEFYISMTYNILIKQNKKIGIYNIPIDNHWAVGTNDDIEKYLQYKNK